MLKTILKWTVALGLILAIAGAGAGWVAYKNINANIPDVKKLKNYSPSLITSLYDINEELIAEFYVEKRILKRFDEIPELVKLATLAIEDDNFYNHKGIDFWGIARAALVNIKAGAIVQGGSTITQQVAKLIFLTHERTFKRKFKELLLSLQIEKHFTKKEILEIYLNQIYYGGGAYGIEAAAQLYFAKPVSQLSLNQVALLAGIPKSPNHFSPHKNPSASVSRRNIVLQRMAELGYVSVREAKASKKMKLKIAPPSTTKNQAPFFAEHVRRYIEKKYGSEMLYHKGLKIYTTLNLKWQKKAQEALKNGILVNDERLGYKGPLGWKEPGKKIDWAELNPELEGISEKLWFSPNRLFKGIVKEVAETVIVVDINGFTKTIEEDGFEWAHPIDPEKDGRRAAKIKNATEIGLKPGDIIEVRTVEDPKSGETRYRLAQWPTVQGALLSIDYATGAIRSMVGGYDFEKSSFNRVVQARRQVGSSFKPIIYSAALDAGLTPATIVIDAPIIYEDDIGAFKNWKPVNFNQKFFGPTTIHQAVTHSRNIVTIKVLEKIGIPYATEYARTLGIVSPLENNLSLALGSSSITLLEMTSVFGIFPNQGIRYEPYFIERLEDSNGNIIEKYEPSHNRVMSEDTAYLISNILRSVVREGTATSVRGVGAVAGGKTGTTNDFMDAWFIGFTPGVVCGVWIGKDKEERLGKNETGSRAAAPIWLSYMKNVVKEMPKKPFTPPPNVIFVRIDKTNGALATPDNANSRFESFKIDEVPVDYTPPEPIS